MGAVRVYGIGNPLIDLLADIEETELTEMSLQKGTMQLIDDDAGDRILAALGDREKTYASGGSCPNTMNTIAALGETAALAGCVGNDELGDIYASRLTSDGVVSDLTRVDGATGTSIILISPDGERTMHTRLGVCRRFAPEAVDHRLVADAEILYVTGYMWDTASQKQAVTEALKTANAGDTTVVFDVADPMAVDRHRDDFRDLIRRDVDIVLANRDEARMLLERDSESTTNAAAELSRWCSMAAVKNGARGSSLGVDGTVTDIPAFNVKAVDTTGAGDNYAAGLIFGLLRGRSAVDAAAFASTVAAEIVQHRGAQFRGQTRAALAQEREYEYSS